MKNLRRILSLIVAMAMLLSCAVVTGASTERFSDVESGDKYAEAIELLAGLGIITGYEDGSFKPNGTITRAEAATIMTRVLGYNGSAAKGKTIFSDVDASHWASGYINIAAEHGIINGFPEGTFCPEDTLTYEQIVKMIVCAIGHELKAKSYGAYPDGYLRAASEAGITKGISGSIGKSASRGLVAQLIYNALEVEMMDATSFSTGIYGTTYSYNGKTLLADYLNIEKVDAVVTDTYLAGENYSSRNKYITLDITKVYELNNRASKTLYDAGDTQNFDEGDCVNASTYLGCAVTAYVGRDEDTGDDTIFAITLDNSRNEFVEVLPDKISVEDSSDSVISYAKRATDKKLTELDLDRRLTVVVNGEIVSDSVSKYFETFDEMTLVNNDKDDEYDVVFISVFDDTEGVEFVVTDIDEDRDVWYFEGDDGSLELDYTDDDVVYTIIRDGKVADVEDIAKGDVITCLDASRSILTVYVSSKTIRGEIEEVDESEGEYYIDDKAYKLSIAFSDDLSVGDYGLFYLNYQGKIAYSTVSSTVASGDYVFITNYDTETKFSKTTYLIQAVNEAGKVVTYTLKSSGIKYIKADGTLVKKAGAAEVYDYLQSETTALSRDYSVNGYVGLARVKVSAAGVINELYIPGRYEEFYEQTKYASENSKEYSVKRGTYGNYELDGTAVVFRVDDHEDSLTDAVEVGTVKSMFTDGGNYVFIAYGEQGEDIEALVVTHGLSKVDYKNHAMIVTKLSKIQVDGEPTWKITGLSKGVTVSYTVDPDESFDISIGNIILVSLNGDGYVSDIETVAYTTKYAEDLSGALDHVDVPGDEDAGIYAGMVENKTNSKFTIRDIEDAFYNSSATSYYLIDYTGREVTFAKSSFSAIKVTSSIESFVVVRTYEDDAIDVFIFRVNAGEVDVDSFDVWNSIKPADPDITEPTEATEATTEAATEATTEAPTEPATAAPTEPATAAPTEPATEAPTEPATATPTEPATAAPTEPATATPTEPATAAPTEPATAAPTEPATAAPTEPATAPPTEPATAAPTEPATAAPTENVTVAATEATDDDIILAEATEVATAAPTEPATEAPTVAPTEPATEAPTEAPTQPATEAPTAPVTETKKVTVDAKTAMEVLALVNAQRKAAGLSELTWDTSLYKVCENYVLDMATYKYLNRTGRDGSTLQTRLANGKITYTLAAENLAKGAKSAAAVVEAWMKSASHKATILTADATKMAVGLAIDTDGSYYWYMVVIK